MFPEAFSPLAITAGLLTNLATDILKAYARHLDGTVAGRLLEGTGFLQQLKRVGIVKKDFAEIITDTVQEALALFFARYPDYALHGVRTFFADPAVSREISTFILNGEPIQQEAIAAALDRHLALDPVAGVLLERRGLRREAIVPYFLECYRRVVNQQAGVPHMAVLQGVVEQAALLMTEIQHLREITEEGLAETLTHSQEQAAILARLEGKVDSIRNVLREPSLSDPISGYIPVSERNLSQHKYFVSHAYNRPFEKDLRKAIRKAFEPELVPYFADQETTPQYILMKIARRIYATRFGVFDFTYFSPNVYIELGLALGANKRVLPICHLTVFDNLPDWLKDITLRYASYDKLPATLRPFVAEGDRGIGKPISPAAAECYFCNRWCLDRGAAAESGYYFVLDLAGNQQQHDEDFRRVVERGLAESGLRARYMDEQLEIGWTICNLARMIQNAEFVICRIGLDADPLVFFGFGVSFGLNKPPLLLVDQRVSPTDLAANLRGWNYHQYDEYDAVEKLLRANCGDLVKQAEQAKIPEPFLAYGQFKAQMLKNIQDLLRNANTPLEVQLQFALVFALKALRTDAGSIMVLARDKQELVITTLVSEDADLTDAANWRTFKINQGIAGWVAVNSRPHVTGNVREDPLYAPKTFNPNLMSLISVPIIFNDQVVGVLNGDSTIKDHFRGDDALFLAEAARLIAPAIYWGGEAGASETSVIHDQLLNPPICLECGSQLHLRSKRVTEDYLRYRLLTVCDNPACSKCGLEEVVQTFTL